MPLLERLKFLCIVSSNLDEFFEIRVSGVKEQIKLNIPGAGPDGKTPREVFQAISRIAHDLVASQYRLLNDIDPSRPRARGDQVPAPQRVHPRTDRVGPRLFPARDDAGADADRARSRAPFPARLQQEPQLRRRAGGARRVRARRPRRDRAGAAHPAAHHQAPARAVERASHDVRLPHLDPARARAGALRRHERARLLPVPRHAQQRPLRRRGGREGPAPRAAGRAAAAALRRRGASGDRRRLPAADDRVPAAAVRPRRGGPLPGERPGEPGPADDGAERGGPRGPRLPAVPARLPGRARRSGST